MKLNDSKIVVAIENAVCHQLEASGIKADPFRLDGEKIIDVILEQLGDFVLVPTKNTKYFSHDGENHEVHDTLTEAKHEAECAIESFRERLADQLCNPAEDGNFQQVGYGIVLAESGYAVDHIVTQEEVDNGEHRYEVGTEIMSLFLIETQEPAND